MDEYPASDSGAERDATVLIIEDEALVRSEVSELLRECGFRVVEVDSAAAAMGAIRSGRVDLVFSDIRMPGPIDGLGLAEWLRQHYPAIPVMLTSGSADAAQQARAVCAEGQFVMKPYRLSDVVERMRTLVAKAP
jgi:CheY-like chemotaxis protein